MANELKENESDSAQSIAGTDRRTFIAVAGASMIPCWQGIWQRTAR